MLICVTLSPEDYSWLMHRAKRAAESVDVHAGKILLRAVRNKRSADERAAAIVAEIKLRKANGR